MHPFRYCPLLAIAMLACLSGGAAAEIFRWTDEDGTVHFSSSPPPGMEIPPSREAPAPTYGGISVAPASGNAESDESAEPTATEEPEQVSSVDMERCQQVREDLISYGDNPRLASVDPETGERTVLSFEQREAAIQQLMSIRDRVCP